MKVVIVGCGTISPHYARTMGPHPQLELAGATDLDPKRARALVAEFGGRAYPSLEAVLADPDVDAVLNLTVHQAHVAVVAACLEAGKHVHTEKPLALDPGEAWRLVELADATGMRLSCAPINVMGEAQQTAWKLARQGRLGTVRLAYAEVNWGRIETWHQAPIPFYEVGALVDVGVYPVTLVTAMFGPARRVTAFARMLEPDRVTLAGKHFTPAAPDFVVGLIELAEGPVVRLTANFYAESWGKQRGLELHGDAAALHLDSWEDFDSRLELRERGGDYVPVPLVRKGFPGKEWARSLVELDSAIAEGRPHRPSAAHAAHVVEILAGVAEAAAAGTPVEIASDFPRQPPMDWAR